MSQPTPSRASYALGSSPYPAPHRGDAVTRDRVTLQGPPTATPISIGFSSPYPDGRRVAWMSTVVGSAIHSGGVDVYRGPARREPRLRCFDLDRPQLTRARRVGAFLRGRALDRACGVRGPVRVVVTSAGESRLVVRVPVARARWQVRLPARLRSAGLSVQARDLAGLRSPTRRIR